MKKNYFTALFSGLPASAQVSLGQTFPKDSARSSLPTRAEEPEGDQELQLQPGMLVRGVYLLMLQRREERAVMHL